MKPKFLARNVPNVFLHIRFRFFPIHGRPHSSPTQRSSFVALFIPTFQHDVNETDICVVVYKYFSHVNNSIRKPQTKVAFFTQSMFLLAMNVCCCDNPISIRGKHLQPTRCSQPKLKYNEIFQDELFKMCSFIMSTMDRS